MVIFATFPSTLLNVVKLNVENSSVASTLCQFVQIKVDNVDSALFNVVDFKINVYNIVSAWPWRSPASRRHINLKSYAEISFDL